MTANDIFNELLKDPILKEKHGISDSNLKKLKLHDKKADFDIIEIIKLAVEGVENDTPQSSVNSQVKNYFSL